MPTSTAAKLKIKPGDTLLALNPPADYKRSLGALPAGAKVISKSTAPNQVHWFVLNQTQLNAELNGVLKHVKEGVLLWAFYPKGTSKLQTDLNRDKGWDALLKHDELRWVTMVSFDETWSALACRLKIEADFKNAKAPVKRAIFDYIDPAKKLVRLPNDFAAALKTSPKLKAFFNTLSFTNRKEYVEWIVSAKRDETRAQRVQGSLERLEKSWKNPRNM